MKPIWRVRFFPRGISARHIGFVVSLLLLIYIGTLQVWAQRPPEVPINVDSVVARVYGYVQATGLQPQSFTSEVYVRHTLQTRRRNVLMRYVPGMFKLERGENAYFGESYARYRFRPPAEVYKKDVAAYTTMPYLRLTRDRWIGRYSLSIYAPNLFTDRFLSPLNRRNRRYYRYALSRSYTSEGRRVASIAVRPRFPNTQLVSGTFDADVLTGRVERFDFSFSYQWARLHVTGAMGTSGESSLLPDRLSLISRLKLLGNVVDERFDGTFVYDLTPLAPAAPDSMRHSRYDLTSQSLLRTDTTSMRYDRAIFDTLRPYPLLGSQEAILQRSDSLREARAAVSDTAQTPRRRRFISQQTEDLLLDSHTFSFGSTSRLKLPPILTPAMLQWTRSRGLSLQTRVEFRATLRGDREFTLSPRVGYNFKQHQVYWRVPIGLDLLTEAGLRLDFEASGGDHMYSAAQADDIREQLRGQTHYDTLVSIFDSFDFHYYRDTRLLTMLSCEPIVGLRLGAGVRYHHRTLIGWNHLAEVSGMSHHLTSLAPRLHVEWTPALYYYRLGRRRYPLHSHWPTLMFDYERGLSSRNRKSSRTARYERFEADAQYVLPLYALRTLSFRLGAGLYTQRGADCFIDYDYFRSNFLPSERRDELTGQFQLLDSRWYNESRHYVRLCAAYESPMLLFSRLKFLSRVVEKERIYLNLLNADRLPFYGEAGYGVSTPLIDVAGFVSLTAHGSSTFGIKLSLSFFDD